MWIVIMPAIGALALGVMLLASGCGKRAEQAAAEKAIESATGNKAEIDAKGEKITLHTEQGEVNIATGDSIRLPENFPKDVYLPPDASVKSVMDMDGALLVNVSIKQPFAQVGAAIGPAMQQQGWKQDMAMQQAGGHAMYSYKKDKRNAMYSVMDNRDEGGSMISLRLSTED